MLFKIILATFTKFFMFLIIIDNTVSSLVTDTSLRRTLGVGPCRFSVILLQLFSQTIRRTMDTFKNRNGQLGSALCSDNLKNVGALHDKKL